MASFQHRSLIQQGYKELSEREFRELEWGLRFTPTACSLLTLIGLVYQQPLLLAGVATLGIWAFLAPAAHPMDLLYNHAVRHMFGASALPPNPFQRRLACLAAGVMNFTAAILFWQGLPKAALAVGGVLLVLQAIVITTHFCTLSWLYELGMKAIGQWDRPIDENQVRELVKMGAVVVDVREPNEFHAGHLEGAVNIPLSQLEKKWPGSPDQTYLIYCASGMRSQLATKKLRARGVEQAHNLGGMARARKLLG